MTTQNHSEHNLLLVIDLQAGWRHKAATEATMLHTVEFCKQFEGDIIHCCFRNNPDSLFHKQLRWTQFVSNTDIAQIPEIEALNLPQYWRSTYSCVTDELLPIFRQYDHVYIAGVFTDVSVAMTAMHLFDLGIPVTVVSDCVATLHGELVHQYALRSIDYAIGKDHVISSRTVLKRIASIAN